MNIHPEHTFTPTELQQIVDCSLQYHFWRQSPLPQHDRQQEPVLQTLQYLHAAGGPRRVNLPATLRFLKDQLSPNAESSTIMRQMIANYHRRLRNEWPQIIASNELLSLNIALARTTIRCESIIDRLDKEDDGGITAIKFVTDHTPVTPPPSANNIEATMLHALTAAAYPHHRPVRVLYRWLYHDYDQSIQLNEKAYRQNLYRLKTRTQAWLDGEILARPGLHCNHCPFKHQGCPIHQTTAAPEDAEPYLAEDVPPATLSRRMWTFMEDSPDDPTDSEP